MRMQAEALRVFYINFLRLTGNSIPNLNALFFIELSDTLNIFPIST